ncbi:MAG: hypothetical protein WC314_11825 [Vulcanimicrobiota bacterium]
MVESEKLKSFEPVPIEKKSGVTAESAPLEAFSDAFKVHLFADDGTKIGNVVTVSVDGFRVAQSSLGA